MVSAVWIDSSKNPVVCAELLWMLGHGGLFLRLCFYNCLRFCELQTPSTAIIGGRTEELSRTLVEKLLAYALCRRLEGYDEIVVDKLMKEIAVDGYRMQTLVTAVVTSYPFTHRRIQEDPKSHGENKLQD
ncbi:MAG: DUF1585 domain-containing protein [Planctomycetaceae bacterium]|nr:DUF1585 domain-containing protein [Planctomycetaceae bacterium]